MSSIPTQAEIESVLESLRKDYWQPERKWKTDEDDPEHYFLNYKKQDNVYTVYYETRPMVNFASLFYKYSELSEEQQEKIDSYVPTPIINEILTITLSENSVLIQPLLRGYEIYDELAANLRWSDFIKETVHRSMVSIGQSSGMLVNQGRDFVRVKKD